MQASVMSTQHDPRTQALKLQMNLPSPTGSSPLHSAHSPTFGLPTSASSQRSTYSNYPGDPSRSVPNVSHPAGGYDSMDLDQVLQEQAQDYAHGQQAHPRPTSETVGDNTDQAPIWADMKTKAGKDRKRLPLACIACRRKKIRCSGEKPACKHCLRSRIPCVYKVTTRRPAPRTDYMAMLDKRLKRMEDRVIKIIPKDQAGTIPAGSRAVLKPTQANAPQAQTAGKRRSAEEAFGAEIEGWAGNASAPNKAVPKKTSEFPGSDHAEEKKLLNEGAEFLPSKEIQEHLAEVYFDYVYGQSYPLLHKPSYMRKLSAGTVPPVLILAVCAISARFSKHPQVPSESAPFLRGECWAKPAREIALKRYDSPNITILIVYLLLGLHEFGTCQGGRSWMLGGMAQRMAYALQLHRDLDQESFGQMPGTRSEMSFTDREIRRRTMWSCFLMDRFNSSGTQRPTSANEEYLNLQLPVKEHFFQMEIPGSTEQLQSTGQPEPPAVPGTASSPHENMGVWAYIIRAIHLWGKLIQYMNLGGRERDQFPIWSEKSKYHQLHQRVKDFQNSIPERLRYNKENLHSHATENTANQFIYFHITVKQLTLFINRFAFPAMANGTRLPKNMPESFLHNARIAALDSASDISNLVAEASDYRVVVPFAGYCVYLSSAVHIHGMFSRQADVKASSQACLVLNIKYLSKMKKYWGMFHFLTESLKELYRTHADMATRGNANDPKGAAKSVFQYGDWYDRYPRGVSQLDYEDPISDSKKEPGTDAVLGQKSDLQSVEDFFATLSPKTKAKHVRKQQKRTQTPTSAPKRSPTSPVSHHSYENLTPSAADGRPPSGDVYGSIPVPQTSASPYGLVEGYEQSQLPPQLQQGPPPPGATFPPPLTPTSSLTFEPMQQSSGMSQLEQQIILQSYNGMDQSLGTQALTENLWDVDFTNFGDDLFNSDNNAAWFLPFNLPLPDDQGLSQPSLSNAVLYGDLGMQRVQSGQSDFDFAGFNR